MTPSADSPQGLLRTGLRGSGDEAERIHAIGLLRARLAEEEQHIAFAMRLRGDAWEDIAQAFGVSRQAAHKRFYSARYMDALAAERSSRGA